MLRLKIHLKNQIIHQEVPATTTLAALQNAVMVAGNAKLGMALLKF
jgi:hypothetical protein